MHIVRMILRGRAAVVLLAASIAPADGAVFRVDPVLGDDANDGSAWVVAGGGIGPKRSIQATVDAATSGDEIWLKKGRHVPDSVRPLQSLTKVGVAIDKDISLLGGFDGTESAAADRDPLRPSLTVIDGSEADSGQPAYNVVATLNGSVVVEGVTVRGGRGVGTGAAAEGAGIYVHGTGTLVARDCWVIDNRTSATASTGGGGLMAVGNVTVERCFFAANASPTRFGGGVASRTNTTLVVRDCVISGNLAGRGGAFSTGGSEDSITIDRSILCGNRADGGYGGGVYIATGAGSRSVTNVVIAGNFANTGGAVALITNGDLDLSNCTFADNSSNQGGVYLGTFAGSNPPVPDFAIRNCVVAGCPPYGVREESASLDIAEISNCLFFSNGFADFRDENATNLVGGAAVNAAPDIVAAGNVDGDPLFRHGATGTWESVNSGADPVFAELVDEDPSTPFVPNGLVGKLIKPDANEPYIFPIVANTGNSVTIVADPSLLALIAAGESYGFRDYQVSIVSPAVDAGADVSSQSPGTLVDLLGVARPVGSSYDIGAYETREPVSSSVTLTSSPNPSGRGAVTSLSATVPGEGPTGVVEFFDGVASLGTQPVLSGTAVLDLSDLALGAHDLKATYSGDDNFMPAESDVHVHAVILGDHFSLH